MSRGYAPDAFIVDEAASMSEAVVEEFVTAQGQEPSATVVRFGPMRDLLTGEVIDPGGCPDEVLARARRSRVEW